MRFLLLLFLLLTSLSAFSSQLVLIQGYLGQSSSWSDSGISRLLEDNDWHYAGEFDYGSYGAILVPPENTQNLHGSRHKFYKVSLPTESSIKNQAFYLSAYLKKLRQLYPQQELILAGHSAGGVVARYVMVKQQQLNVKMLITIASPHLGTDTAEFGKLIADSPFAYIAPLIGAGALNRSQSLYADLLPEMPHRFLYWLNRQPHPEAEYISIVRDQQSVDCGDYVVPQESQFLENVYSLRYRAKSYIVKGNHGLTSEDGLILVDLINTKNMPHISGFGQIFENSNAI